MSNSLLVVIPPQAVSLLNGPPLAPLIIRHYLETADFKVDLFDANAQLFQWLCKPERSLLIVNELKRVLQLRLSRSDLSHSDLTEIGYLLAYLNAEEQRGQSATQHRSGIQWSGSIALLFENLAGDATGANVRDNLLTRAYGTLVNEILRRKPSSIAFSILFHTQYEPFIKIASELRTRGFSGRIIAGGAGIRLCTDNTLLRLLRESGADLLFLHTMYGPKEPLHRFLTGDLVASDVPNSASLSSGALNKTALCKSRASPLPLALSYSCVDATKYHAPFIYPVLVSEGCYWGKCEFCDYPFLAEHDAFLPGVLFRSPSSLLSDIRHIVNEFGVRSIDLISDSIPYGYFLQLKKTASKELPLLAVSMECSVRAEPKATLRHFEAMAECGIKSITIGIEALNDDVLARMKKGITYEEIYMCVRLAQASGIKVKANFIVDYPRLLPTHVPEMLERLRELSPYLNAIGVHNFTLSPFSPMAKLPQSGHFEMSEGQSDHGEHHFTVRTGHEDDPALLEFANSVRNLAFALARKNGETPAVSKVLKLPFRWMGDGRAEYNEEESNLLFVTPSDDAVFKYLVTETTP